MGNLPGRSQRWYPCLVFHVRTTLENTTQPAHERCGHVCSIPAGSLDDDSLVPSQRCPQRRHYYCLVRSLLFRVNDVSVVVKTVVFKSEDIDSDLDQLIVGDILTKVMAMRQLNSIRTKDYCVVLRHYRPPDDVVGHASRAQTPSAVAPP
ncbi:hypothetical protein EVAR_86403_1 [Eumeta japonica]|uniref:Uncharacterized protein n=1 Tax=Eumeta variegata TaxID=151549 RepID=A0A4C1WBF3_EUMVA|nr:hypothetical protein EVAR_86403_1 [Eumeta japonica]